MSSRSPISRRGFLGGTAAVLGGAAGGTLLTACGGDQSGGSAAGGSGGEPADVTFLAILPMTSLTFTPEYVADTAGFYEDHNLNVTFETTRGSAPAIQTILADSAFITRVGDNETMIAAGERDAPALSVGVNQRKAPMRIASSSNNPIESPEDLEGKKIGLPSEGGTSELTVDLVLAKAGMGESAIQKQVVGGFSPSSYNLVESGRLDGYVVSADISVELQQQRPDAVIFDLGEELRVGSQVYMTSRNTAESSADLIRRFLQATWDAMDFVIKDAENDFQETIELLENSDYDIATLQNPEVAKGSLQNYVDSWLLDGPENLMRHVEDRWTGAYQDLVEAGMIEDGLDPGQWYTNEYLPGG